jgi:RNA polymerase sigma factor (sigma-70 family)
MQANMATELLERLNRGELSVAEDLYLAYTTYLRVVVRRLLSSRLRPSCDSSDVLQSVWVHVVRSLGTNGWQIDTEEQLRALLAIIARRGVVRRVRSYSRIEIEGEAADRLDSLPARGQSRPSEIAQGEELWHRMIDMCTPEHRSVLELRRQGLPLAEVAARTGFHEGSVRRIIRRLARELAIHRRTPPGGSDAAIGVN